MVRSLVGSLVEVGRGRENAAGLMERLRAVSRHRMPDPGPAHGLCLVSVAYDAHARSPEPTDATDATND
jgi:tRNA pseudouridine38-40 synthase